MIAIAKGNLIVGVCNKKLDVDIAPYRYVDVNKIDLYDTSDDICKLISMKIEGN